MKRKVKLIYTFEQKDKEYFMKWLEKHGYSLREFAKELDVSPTFLSAVICGKKKVPDKMVELLSDYTCFNTLFPYHVTNNYIFQSSVIETYQDAFLYRNKKDREKIDCKEFYFDGDVFVIDKMDYLNLCAILDLTKSDYS